MPENAKNVNSENPTTAPDETATVGEETTVDLSEKSTEEISTVVEESTVAHNIGFTPDSLSWSLPMMGKGMLGIFIVTTIIVTVTVVLNKATTPRKNKQGKYSPDKK